MKEPSLVKEASPRKDILKELQCKYCGQTALWLLQQAFMVSFCGARIYPSPIECPSSPNNKHKMEAQK